MPTPDPRAPAAGTAALEAVLAESPLFRALPPARRRELATSLPVRRLRSRQVLFAMGDDGSSAFLVVQGTLRLTWPSRHGEELVVRTARPPDLLGELALLDGQPRSAWAEASGAAAVAVIDGATWSALLDDPRFSRALLADVARRLRSTTHQLAEHALVDLAGRVAAELMRLADAHGRPEGDAIRVELPMTQGELAAVVAASRQSVNQVLRSFQRKGDIEADGQNILIRRPDALRRRASV